MEIFVLFIKGLSGMFVDAVKTFRVIQQSDNVDFKISHYKATMQHPKKLYLPEAEKRINLGSFFQI